MYFFRGKSATINDGELKGFEKEPYVQEIIGGKGMKFKVGDRVIGTKIFPTQEIFGGK